MIYAQELVNISN